MYDNIISTDENIISSYDFNDAKIIEKLKSLLKLIICKFYSVFVYRMKIVLKIGKKYKLMSYFYQDSFLKIYFKRIRVYIIVIMLSAML